MSEDKIYTDLMELKDFLDEKFLDWEARLANRLNEIDTKQIKILLAEIKGSLEHFAANAQKFENMMKELNGTVVRCRALFDHQKDRTPVWYDISHHVPPERGEIWIKDINGAETLATCKGRAIIYPASSVLKEPEFWKPV